jgi:hypothetical protein
VLHIDTTLLVACQLLNNPPPSGAPPSAAEQWRHDVGQLVVTAINTLPQERWRQPFTQYSCTPSTACAPSVAHAPSIARAPPIVPNARQSTQHRIPMVSYTTTDLKAEISHRHGGEDSCITIERQHERCQNIEGCNLMKDFDSHAPVRGSPAARVPHPPSSPGVSGGVHGTGPTPAYGGLATQVVAPPSGEV